MFDLSEYLHDFTLPAWQPWARMSPWALVADAPGLVAAWLAGVSPDQYRIADGQAIHRSATVEPGALLKGPLVVGPGCFIAAGALLRGGCWLGEGCIIGANAVLAPGALLAPGTVIGRAALYDAEAL